MSDHTDQRVLLNKYLNDPKKKLLESEERNGGQSYLFRSSVTDLPDEIRYNDVWFFDNGKTVRMSRQTEVRQKFLCINGPLAGQKIVSEDAQDYVSFNRSSSRSELDKGIPSVVLIYRESLLL